MKREKERAQGMNGGNGNMATETFGGRGLILDFPIVLATPFNNQTVSIPYAYRG